MQHVRELLDLVCGRVESAAQSDIVVGSPIELGNVTVVPMSRISVGFGVGGGSGQGEAPSRGSGKNRQPSGKGKGEGGGTGGGAKVRPVGVAIFTEEGVDIVPIADRPGLLDKLFEKIPELAERVNQAMGESWAGGGKQTKKA
jgi:uncharacterized spore protein YtfJ